MRSWLAVARADFSETGARGTDETAKTPVSSVLTVPQPATPSHFTADDQAPLEPGAAARRRRVLAFLDGHPSIQRAVRTDVSAERGKVIVMIGLRGVGTGEVEIPTDRYDGFALMALLDKYATGGAIGDDQMPNERFNERSNP